MSHTVPKAADTFPREPGGFFFGFNLWELIDLWQILKVARYTLNNSLSGNFINLNYSNPTFTCVKERPYKKAGMYNMITFWFCDMTGSLHTSRFMAWKLLFERPGSNTQLGYDANFPGTDMQRCLTMQRYSHTLLGKCIFTEYLLCFMLGAWGDIE